MKDILLFGGGGHCYATIELIRSLGEYSPTLVYDDKPKSKNVMGVPLMHYQNEKVDGISMCISIGNNKIRSEKAQLFPDANFPSFIHKSTVVYPSVTVGKGSLVLPNAVLDAECNVGDFCIVNSNATVSHNVLIENFVHVAINVAIAGGVTVGEGSLLGAGSIILPEIKIGKWAIIGAGAVVTKDVPDNAIVFGNPAQVIKVNNVE